MSMIKLKNLIESLEDTDLPEKHSPITSEEKRNMYNTIHNFNEYRNSLKASSVHEVTEKIKSAIKFAEAYTLNESGDWMESKMIKDDMKEMKKISENLYKESEKIKEVEKQMELLYEQLGMRLERYFKIKDIKKIEKSSEDEKSS